MSEVPVLVPIFPYADEGSARPSSYFRQGNWKSETNCLKICDEKLRRRQKLWNKLGRRPDFFDWILMCPRFFWLNLGPIACHWENGEIRCGLWGITQRQGEIRCRLWGITQKKVWAAGSPLSERWNKVRAFEESLRDKVWAASSPLSLSGQWSPSLYELWVAWHVSRVWKWRMVAKDKQASEV